MMQFTARIVVSAGQKWRAWKMNKTICPNCGQEILHYGTIYGCNQCFFALIKVNPDRKQRLVKTKPKAKKRKKIVRRKTLTPAQKAHIENLKDRAKTARADMVEHVKRLIDDGKITVQDYCADPSSYFDSRVMGAYVKNQFIRKAVSNEVFNHYLGEAMC